MKIERESEWEKYREREKERERQRDKERKSYSKQRDRYLEGRFEMREKINYRQTVRVRKREIEIISNDITP